MSGVNSSDFGLLAPACSPFRAAIFASARASKIGFIRNASTPQSPNETTFTLHQLTPRPPLHEGEKQPVQQKRGIRSAS